MWSMIQIPPTRVELDRIHSSSIEQQIRRASTLQIFNNEKSTRRNTRKLDVKKNEKKKHRKRGDVKTNETTIQIRRTKLNHVK